MKHFLNQVCLLNLLILGSCQLSYSDETNSEWSSICTSGKSQSPIDFPDKFSLYNTNKKIKIDHLNYGMSNYNAAGSQNITLMLNILDLYNYQAVITNNLGGYMNVTKDKITYQYDLVEMNFHYPSEHKIAGLSGNLEVQLKHVKNNNALLKNGITFDPDPNNILMVSVLFKTSTIPNSDLENFVQALKNKKSFSTNIHNFIPTNRPFFFYEGSLTTPTCVETVNWIVSQEIEYMSESQYSALQNWIDTTFLGKTNNRQIKEIGTRQVYYQYFPDASSNTCYLKILYYIFIVITFYI